MLDFTRYSKILKKFTLNSLNIKKKVYFTHGEFRLPKAIHNENVQINFDFENQANTEPRVAAVDFGIRFCLCRLFKMVLTQAGAKSVKLTLFIQGRLY